MSTYNSKTVKEMKANARGQLVGKYSGAILAMLLVTAIQLFVVSLSDSAYTGSINSYLIRLLITIIIDLLSGILIYGQTRYFLLIARGQENLKISEIFYGFKNNMDKAVLIQAVYTIVSVLSSVPVMLVSLGIWPVSEKQYILVSSLSVVTEYLLIFVEKLFLGLCFFILDDNPEMSVPEIFSTSCSLMKNKKGRYFLICLSMVPLFILGWFAFFVGALWVAAYLQTSLANLYLDCIGEEPAPAFRDSEHDFTASNSTSEIH